MRYYLMEDSSDTATSDNSLYKDVLSANFLNSENEFTYTQHELTQPEVKRFDLFVANTYGSMKYMDLLLEVNNIEHRSNLYAGFFILLPGKNELDNFLRRRRKV